MLFARQRDTSVKRALGIFPEIACSRAHGEAVLRGEMNFKYIALVSSLSPSSSTSTASSSSSLFIYLFFLYVASSINAAECTRQRETTGYPRPPVPFRATRVRGLDRRP